MRVRILLVAAGLAAVALGLWFGGIKNDLDREREIVAEQWANVEAALAKRAGDIPHVLEAVRRENDPVLPQIAATRQSLAEARGPEEKIRANRELSLALARLMLQCETDKRTRESGGFRLFREALAAHEDEIANARSQYNSALEHYNARMQRFPDNVVASLAGFSRNEAYFGTGPDSAIAPKPRN